MNDRLSHRSLRIDARTSPPLDNKLCEQVLKRAVLYRKNALSYRTLNGAEVGDLFMSSVFNQVAHRDHRS